MPASRPCPDPTCYQLQPCSTHVRIPFQRAVKYAGGRAWQATRLRIFARDGYQCRLGLGGCNGRAEVVDHRLNRARGGSDDDANLQAACKPCNERKRRLEAREGRRSAIA